MKYVCDVCGWEYDEAQGYPEAGIAPGTKWEDVPADFQCPLCYVGKDEFSEGLKTRCSKRSPAFFVGSGILPAAVFRDTIASFFNRK